MKQYSADLRERLLRAIDAGLGQAEAARLFGVGTSTIKRWKRQRRETGTLAPKARPGRTPLIGPAQRAALEAQVGAAPDATLAEHCATWERAHGVRVSTATMSRALARLGWPLKKRPSSPASGTRRSAPPGGRTSPRPSPPRTSSSSTRAARTGR
jgi:transposase